MVVVVGLVAVVVILVAIVIKRSIATNIYCVIK